MRYAKYGIHILGGHLKVIQYIPIFLYKDWCLMESSSKCQKIFPLTKCQKQAGVELCQAQVKLS
jgi:hypothetical protein